MRSGELLLESLFGLLEEGTNAYFAIYFFSSKEKCLLSKIESGR